jgi:hypothetical protein
LQPEYIFLFTAIFAIIGSFSFYNYARIDRLTKKIEELQKTTDSLRDTIDTVVVFPSWYIPSYRNGDIELEQKMEFMPDTPDCVLRFGERAGDESIEL